jgi:hypothetical protein
MRDVRDVESAGNLDIKGADIPEWATPSKYVYEKYPHPKEFEAITREHIARSKINPKKFFTRPVSIRENTGYMGNAVGQYYRDRDAIELATDTKKAFRDDPTTLLHELGHYKDKDYMGKRLSSTLSPERRHRVRGIMEGSADAFAHSNVGMDPRTNYYSHPDKYQRSASWGRHVLAGNEDTSTIREWSRGYEKAYGRPLLNPGNKRFMGLSQDSEETLSSHPGYSYPPERSPFIESEPHYHAVHPETGEHMDVDELLQHYESGK